MQGKIKFYNSIRGFGFIYGDKGGEIFYHHSHVVDEGMMEGDEVEYEVIEGKHGLMATNIKRI